MTNDAYLRDGRRFLLQYFAAVIVGAFLLRWAMHEPNELISDAMFLVPGLLFFGSGFVGAAACEIYFTMKGYDVRDTLFPAPKWYRITKSLSFVAMVFIVAGFDLLVAKL